MPKNIPLDLRWTYLYRYLDLYKASYLLIVTRNSKRKGKPLNGNGLGGFYAKTNLQHTVAHLE